MGWYLIQQWFALLLALAIGILLGFLWFRLRWKRVDSSQSHELTRIHRLAADHEADASAHKLQLTDLRSEHEARLIELDSVRGDLGDAHTRYEATNHDLMLSRGRVGELEAERTTAAAALQAERTTTAASLHIAERDAVQANARAEAAERDLLAVRSRVADLEAQLADLLAARQAQEAALTELRAVHSEAERNVIDLRTQVDSREQESTQLRSRHGELDRELISARSSHQTAERELGAIRSAHAATQSEASTLRSDLTARSNELVDLRDVHSRQADDLARVQREHAASLAEIEQLEARSSAALDECRQARERAELEVSRIQAELTEARTPTVPDDLKVIEGIGPKMEAALNKAGILTFVQLTRASEEQLHRAIEAEGLHFAPSVPTWARQADYLVKGDDAGFKAYTDHLVAGREPEKG